MAKSLFGIQSDSVPGGSLDGKYSRAWLEDSFDFETASGKQIEVSKTRDYLGVSLSGKIPKRFL